MVPTQLHPTWHLWWSEWVCVPLCVGGVVMNMHGCLRTKSWSRTREDINPWTAVLSLLALFSREYTCTCTLYNPPSQFSRLGTQVFYSFCCSLLGLGFLSFLLYLCAYLGYMYIGSGFSSFFTHVFSCTCTLYVVCYTHALWKMKQAWWDIPLTKLKQACLASLNLTDSKQFKHAKWPTSCTCTVVYSFASATPACIYMCTLYALLACTFSQVPVMVWFWCEWRRQQREDHCPGEGAECPLNSTPGIQQSWP